MTKDFFKTLAGYQKEIDKELKAFFDREIKKEKRPFLREAYAFLKEFSLRPAKRIRPIMVNYGYLLGGGKERKRILSSSVFMELIHNHLLIHDDIIDEDEIRRGGPAAHMFYQKEAFKNKSHHGISMAVVAGDLIGVMGRDVLAEASFPEKNKIEALKKLNEILVMTAYGEMFEVLLREKLRRGERVMEKDILDVYKTKTAFYTFIGPLQIGALLAGANQKTLKMLEAYGSPLGIAFQIRDDLQEIFGREEEVGSKLGSDIKEGQPSFVISKAMNSDGGGEIKKYLGKKDLSKKDLKKVKDIIVKTGAYDSCIVSAKRLISQAKKSLEGNNGGKRFLMDLADYVLERKR